MSRCQKAATMLCHAGWTSTESSIKGTTAGASSSAVSLEASLVLFKDTTFRRNCMKLPDPNPSKHSLSAKAAAGSSLHGLCRTRHGFSNAGCRVHKTSELLTELRAGETAHAKVFEFSRGQVSKGEKEHTQNNSKQLITTIHK